MERKKVAVIGGGMAGLTSAYFLNQKHDVSLYEKSDRLGGNAYTLFTRDHQQLDIAAAVFGLAGYGHFYALLDELGVETDSCANTFMTFHNLDTKEGLYLTPSLKGGLMQGLKLLKVKNFKNLIKMYTGMKKANQLLAEGKLSGLSLKEGLAKIPEMQGDTKLVFLCVLCLLSSMSWEEVMAAPAEFFIKKLNVHNDVISPKSLFSVRAVKGGTKAYVDKLARPLVDNTFLEAKIKNVERFEDRIEVHFENGESQSFDQVVFACNSDQALKLIKNPSALEKELLGSIAYKDGKVVVHKDHSHFPARDLIQAYTFLYTNKGGRVDTSVNGALWYEPNVPNDSVIGSLQVSSYLTG